MMNIYFFARFFAAVFLLIILAGTNSEQESRWLAQSRPTDRNLRSIFFTDSLTGWIGGDSGLIMRTTDGGKVWTSQATGLFTPVYSIFFTGRDTGYALAWELDNTPPNFYGTRLLSTTNGGAVWNNYLFPDSNYFANSIYFRDRNNGYLVGTQGRIYFSTNRGITWDLSVVDSGFVFGFPVEEIRFYNANSGYAVGGAIDIAGVVWRTSNSGRTWQTRIVGPEPVNDIHIFDSLNAIGVGGDFEYGSSRIVTENSGGDWKYTEYGIFGIANTIEFRTRQEAWVSLGIVDSFLVTTDAGSTWNITAVPQQGRIYNIFFADERNGWAIGNNGILLRYNRDLINVRDGSLFNPGDYVLRQNYPNPFNPSTTIGFDLKQAADVRISVFNVEGKLIAEPVNRKLNSGTHDFSFSGEGLSSGIYIYSLEVNGVFSASRKMILLK